MATTGYEQITVGTNAVGFTTSLLSNAGGHAPVAALVVVSANPLRYRTDGTNPTSSIGMPLAANSTVAIYGADELRAFRAIRSGGSDAVIDVTYYDGPPAVIR
jgi:hypothetical protein